MYTVLLLIFVISTMVFGWRAFSLSRTRRALLERYLRSTFIIENLNDGIIEHDTDHTITRLNPAAETLLGVSAEEVIGKQLKPEDRQNPYLGSLAKVVFSQLSEEATAGKDRYGARGVIIEKPEERKLKIFTIPKISGFTDKPRGFIKIVRDITRDEIIAQNKTDLVAIVAHQLRTPLAGVKWILKALLEGDFGAMSAEQKELISRANTANEGMINLIDDILDVAKIEQSDFTYNFESADLIAFIRGIIDSHAEEARAKGIKLEASYGPSRLETVFDKRRLRIAIANLVANGIHYSEQGSPVEIRVSQEADKVLISVKDYGIGIPEENQPQVFSKFFRGKNAQRMRTRGTGLGLFLAKAVVEGHGGRMWFESKENQGSTFFIELPIKTPSPTASAATAGSVI